MFTNSMLSSKMPFIVEFLKCVKLLLCARIFSRVRAQRVQICEHIYLMHVL